MIRYALKCADGHEFESWFQSAAAFDALAAAGHLSCAVCGGGEVRKALMAPRVVEKQIAPAAQAAPEEADRDTAIARLRKEVEEKATYVGGEFATRARAMHAGDAPETAIYGETTPKEARALLEDGIPVAPLPFKPKRKMQ